MKFGIVAGLLVAAFAGPAAGEPPPLTTDSFQHYADILRPDEQELCFLDIEWRSTFAEGVEEAYRVRKPVLLWAMNGHPLGCT